MTGIGNLSLMVSLLRARKSGHILQEPSFFRTMARTRSDNAYIKEFLDHFLNFIFWGKGVTIGTYIWRKASCVKGNGMIMNTMGRRESLGSGKYHLMFRKEGLEVSGH